MHLARACSSAAASSRATTWSPLRPSADSAAAASLGNTYLQARGAPGRRLYSRYSSWWSILVTVLGFTGHFTLDMPRVTSRAAVEGCRNIHLQAKAPLLMLIYS